MSSAVAARTGRSDATVEPMVDPPASAPNRMLDRGRPIAFAMSWVSKAPEAPTSVPATIISVFPRT
jgi:hypothetical protein